MLPQNLPESAGQPQPTQSPMIRVGVDIGGTFTDFVVFYPETGALESFKRLSTPHDPAEAVLSGLERLRPAAPHTLSVTHGSTVATNALLERKGARTALITTQGFRDVLEIGRQNRPILYDLFAGLPSPLIPQDLRFEVVERVDHYGRVQVPFESQELEHMPTRLQALGVQSVAVCLLFSFLHPDHERRIAERLRAAGFFVSASHEILPEYREYERTSTTAVNAYVSPVLDHYLTHLERAAQPSGPVHPGRDRVDTRMRVMQSNGGSLSLKEARRSGVRCILSGPAGGLVGARHVAELAFALEGDAPPPALNLLTFDMGGTSTDVSLIAGEPRVTTETTVGGCPIHIPVLDIHTIGAGGGSIASVDLGGALRVGPESAGADPGPACYARRLPEEGLPTVTDANLVLGRLLPEYFLGGRMQLDSTRAWQALERLGARLDLDPQQAALGVIEVVNAHMERALRVISVERGHDPRAFTLLSFGGAGGLHAADLARRLKVPRLFVPPMASTLSALGMLVADVVKDYTQTVMLDGDTPVAALQQAFEPLESRGRQELQADGFLPEQVRMEPSLDLRYAGQSYELSVPWQANGELPWETFHALHRRAYGYDRPGAPLEIVNLRLRVSGKTTPPRLPIQPVEGPDPSPALLGLHPVVFGAGEGSPVPIPIPFYRGEALRPGNRFSGPAAVVRADTTLILGPGDRSHVDPFCNLLITFS